MICLLMTYTGKWSFFSCAAIYTIDCKHIDTLFKDETYVCYSVLQCDNEEC